MGDLSLALFTSACLTCMSLLPWMKSFAICQDTTSKKCCMNRCILFAISCHIFCNKDHNNVSFSRAYTYPLKANNGQTQLEETQKRQLIGYQRFVIFCKRQEKQLNKKYMYVKETYFLKAENRCRVTSKKLIIPKSSFRERRATTD